MTNNDSTTSTMLAPPSTGKRQKAKRVFGSFVDNDLDCSLAYSPSPLPRARCDDDSRFQQEPPLVTSLFPTEEESTSPLMNDNNTSKEAQDQSSLIVKDISLLVNDSSPKSDGKEECDTRSSCETDKENAPQNLKAQASDSSTDKKDSFRRAKMSRDLLKKTQEAVDKANDSVNQSLNAARKAKHQAMREKAKERSKVATQWKEENLEVKSFYEAVEKGRRERLAMRRQLSSKLSQAKASRVQQERMTRIEEVDKESKFKSEVFRDHRNKLNEQLAKKKRESMEVRAKIRINHREGAERLRLMRVEEDNAHFDERMKASAARREAIKAEANKRRKSYQFRNGDARRIRELHIQMEEERQCKEQQSYELKFAANRDADEYKRKLAEDRRKSLALRNKTAYEQREAVKVQESEEREAEHESFELTAAARRDADAYKKKLEAERRESLASRNKKAKEQREQERLQELKDLNDQHASCELKWNAEKDAEAYKKSLEHERRESLAFRNKEGKRQREYMSQQHKQHLDQRQKDAELKWAAEKDAEDYKKQLDAERRESFASRNLNALKQRNETSLQESATREAEHESYELKWAAEKDAEEYQKKLEQERRDSFAFRNKEKARHAKVMEELNSLYRQKETESLVLKWAGDDDGKAYLAKLKKERKKSLQLRGEEFRRIQEYKQNLHDEAIMKRHEEEELQEACQRDVEAYKKQCAERDRESLCFRQKEARLQRLEEETQQQRNREVEEENFELETLARNDVEDYVQDCKSRRRMSLVYRAKEKRRNAKWKREQEEQEREKRTRQVRDRLMDSHYVELARQEERAQIALDAIRHAGCTFSTNPFGFLLDS